MTRARQQDVVWVVAAAVVFQLALSYKTYKNRHPKSIKLTYFDIKGVAESIRLAFTVGGIKFEDERLTREQFAAIKPTLPFLQAPVLTVDGETVAQSAAILRYAGKLSGLYPLNYIEAAKCDAVLDSIADMGSKLRPSMLEKDEAKKLELRAAFVPEVTSWFTCLSALLKKGGGAHFADGKLTVADIAVSIYVQWLTSGLLDGVPKTVLQPFPLLQELVTNTMAHPKIAAYYAARS